MKKALKTMGALLLIAILSVVFIEVQSGCEKSYAQRDPKPQSNFVHTDYSAGKVAYNDSTYIDSTRYPQITNTFDASLITGQVDSLVKSGTNPPGINKNGIIFRAMLVVTCPTGVTCTPKLDTVWAIIQTKDEGGYRYRNDDTITIVGSATTDTVQTGMFTFQDYPRGQWRIRFEEKKTLDHVNFTNRNGDYILLSITAKNMDIIPPKINPGNF